MSGKEFPKFEDWQAPWEKSDTDFDADAAKKAIYKLTRQAHIDAEKHQQELTTVRGELETEKGAKADLQKKVNEAEDAKITDAQERANAQLKRELAELKELITGGAAPEAGKEKETPQGVTEADRLRVALELGLTEKQAGRLQGATLEELRTDGQAYAEDLGLEVDPMGYDDGQGDPSGMPSRVPSRSGYRTDLGGGGGSRTFDPAKERDTLVG